MGAFIYYFLFTLLVFFIYGAFRPKFKCPICGNSLPWFRNPPSLKIWLRGGWRCSNCHSFVSRNGRFLSK